MVRLFSGFLVSLLFLTVPASAQRGCSDEKASVTSKSKGSATGAKKGCKKVRRKKRQASKRAIVSIVRFGRQVVEQSYTRSDY